MFVNLRALATNTNKINTFVSKSAAKRSPCSERLKFVLICEISAIFPKPVV